MSETRRTTAWVLLLVTGDAFLMPRLSGTPHPALLNGARMVFRTGVAFLSVRLVTFLLIDPLLRERKTSAPGFARDLLVQVLYGFVFAGVLKEVVGITWRTVQMKNDFGDMDIIPNRMIAQAVVTNLSAPTGLHKRSFKLAVVPKPDLHVAIEKLTTALAGIPHFSYCPPPEVAVCGTDLGGALLECRY